MISLPLLTIAQDEESGSDFIVGAEVVSSYIWRGLPFDRATNIQPVLEFSSGNFGVGSWSSFNVIGTYSETDWYMYYSLGNLTLTVNEYYTDLGQDYFDFDSETTSHILELMAKYTISENLPLSITASVLPYGADKKYIYGVDDKIVYDLAGDPQIDPTKNNYSMYFELGYQFTKNATTVDLFAGFTPADSYFYAAEGFSFINVGLTATQAIKITDNFSVPIKIQGVVNPELNKLFFVFGFKLNL